MKVYDAPNIRNVAVVGHGGCGKTSLVSALLFDAGAVNRLGRVDDGTTVTDFDPDEIERKISLLAALAFAEWKKTKVNLIDAPGYANFLSEARAALRVADAALVVVDAVAGVEVQTEKVWGYAEEGGLRAPGRGEPHGPRERLLRAGARVGPEVASAAPRCRSRSRSARARRFKGVVDLVAEKAQLYADDASGKFQTGGDPGRAAGDREGLAREARRDGRREQRGADGGVLREGHALAGAAREGPARPPWAPARSSRCCPPRRC